MFSTQSEALAYIFKTYDRVKNQRGLDEETRDVSPTRRLIMATGLADITREYVTITGSKGKGSTAALTAQLLQALGHRVGLVTSPHLRSWYERIRVNGQAIPEADFLRILAELRPFIDAEIDSLTDQQYISPQGIFLLIALRYFDEQQVAVGVLEVGRGGRFDDMAIMPNKVSLFTPIMIEHAQYLGSTLDRIAWHKAGIISAASYVYSLPQAPEVLDIIKREADATDSEMFWFSQLDLAEYVADIPTGIRMRLQRYGEIDLPFYARYILDNATLAVQAAGNVHGRLPGISHASPEYVERIRHGLSTARWFGRGQKLADAPAVYLDGAINVLSARDWVDSMASRRTTPTICILGVPHDRPYAEVYAQFGRIADAIILTESQRNLPKVTFPPADVALSAARQYCADVTHTTSLAEAVTEARQRAGTEGTIILSVAQPLVGDAMDLWDIDTSSFQADSAD